MSLVFVACLEPGYLEDQGVALFRSIREWAGTYASARIVSVQPRDLGPLRASTEAQLGDLRIEQCAIPLNLEFSHDPLANKIFAGAWVEQHSDEDVVVFLDSDAFVFGEPADLELDEQTAAAVRPVFKKGIGTSGPDDPNDGFWVRLWEICGSGPPPYVETVVGGDRIRSYWNSGLVAARRTEGLFAQWLRNFRALVEARHFPPGGKLRHVEQTALAGTLALVAPRVKVLDGRYNYPLDKRDALPEPQRTAQLEELVHVHYLKAFDRAGFLETLNPPLAAGSERARWLRRLSVERLSRRAARPVRGDRAPA